MNPKPELEKGDNFSLHLLCARKQKYRGAKQHVLEFRYMCCFHPVIIAAESLYRICGTSSHAKSQHNAFDCSWLFHVLPLHWCKAVMLASLLPENLGGAGVVRVQ